MTRYKTIKGISSGEYSEKKSRFISYLLPCKSEEEAKKHIKRISNEHHKSTHVCYAFSTGVNNSITRFSNAHEPANTAGPPILNQIIKYQLKNVLIAVVRYFGGIKLGKGGLVRAYGTVAENAILNAEIVEVNETATMKIEVSFPEFQKALDVLKKNDASNVSHEFGQTCVITFDYRPEDYEKINNVLLRNVNFILYIC